MFLFFYSILRINTINRTIRPFRVNSAFFIAFRKEGVGFIRELKQRIYS